MERGANTFPFHNLLPYSESNEGLFRFFSPSLNWIKEKLVATLAIRNICDTKNLKVSSPYYRCLCRIFLSLEVPLHFVEPRFLSCIKLTTVCWFVKLFD